MNYPMIRYLMMWVFRILGLLMFLPCIIALIYGEKQGIVYLIMAACVLAAGAVGAAFKPKNTEVYQKEGFVIVGFSWIFISMIGAIPFVLTKEIPNFINALFETASGFTTTGSSILTNVEAMSHTSLFWRSFTHWIGGMGVLVFLLMLLPGKSGSRMNLMRAESPGPDVTKFVPRVRNTAIILYRIYLAMTLIEIGALLLTRMNWFDALCISFGTAGTGGFGVLNASCGAYSPVQQWIIFVCMISFGVNFGFYYLFLRKKPGSAIKMQEVRAYLLIIVAAGALITFNVHSMYPSFGETVRHAFFQVGTVITTTGFATTDFNTWPALSKVILLLLMIIGACAGSTGGGIKVSRAILTLKSIKNELISIAHPRSVRKIRMDGRVVAQGTIRAVHAFMVGYAALIAVSLFVISFDGFSLETNISAVVATISNIGPGFDMVGPASNYADFSYVSKIMLTFNMIAGRLELFPIFLLCYPGTWNKH